MRSVAELVVRWWCSASPGSASLPCFSKPSGGRQVGQVVGHQVDGLAGVGLGEHRLDRRPFGGGLVVAGQGDVPPDRSQHGLFVADRGEHGGLAHAGLAVIWLMVVVPYP
jgi:hypothetical protein